MLNFKEAPIRIQLAIYIQFIRRNPYYGTVNNPEENAYILRALARRRIFNARSIVTKFEAITGFAPNVFDIANYAGYLRDHHPESTNYNYYFSHEAILNALTTSVFASAHN